MSENITRKETRVWDNQLESMDDRLTERIDFLKNKIDTESATYQEVKEYDYLMGARSAVRHAQEFFIR